MKKFDVLGLGAVAVDELILAESYPVADAKTRVLKHERQCGGLTATALIAASRLGAKCAYAGRLGHDEFSRFAIAQMAKEKIDLHLIKAHSKARPTHSFIIVDAQKQTRNVFSHRPEVAGPADDWPSPNVIRSTRVLLVDHFSPKGMLRAARIARDAGIPVVADFERDSGPEFAELFQLADHLILSQQAAAKFSLAKNVKRSLRKLWSANRKLVAVTCGEKGCWFVTSDSPATVQHQPAFKVNAVDTTGCGDVFHGVYAGALAQGLEIRACLRFASAAAAWKATRFGGEAGILKRREVEMLLRRQTALHI